MEILYQQTSPKGTATIDVSRLLIGADGVVYERRGSHADRIVQPVTGERLAAIEGHFGAPWRDAVAAMRALAGG